MNDDLLLKLQSSLGSLSKEDFKEILAEIDNVAWVERYRILKGKPFSFDQRKYLLQPYRDEYPNLIFYKGRQVEMSEFSINWLLRRLYKYPYTAGLHAFPRMNQALKFAKQRIDPAIKDSQLLSKWYDERGSEQVMRKFVKEPDPKTGLAPYNFYILGATWESRKDTVGDAARGISLDFIVYDERQDHPNDVETVLGEGASHSEYKHTLTLGTPKLPGTQFDQQWESSDKHFWHVKCEHCGREEIITMDNILDSGDEEIGYYYGCTHCRQPLNRENGRWLPTNPQKRPYYRGYHISQLLVPWLSANDIMRKYHSPTFSKRRFYNEVLGFAYGGDDIPITQAMIQRCTENDYKLGEHTGTLYAGIDWGATSYCVIEEKTQFGHKLVDCFIVSDSDPREHPKKIARYIKKYTPHVKKVVCDAGPDITRFYNLRDELKSHGVRCEVWACYYATPPAKTTMTWNEKEMNVTVGRSEMIEMIIDEVSDAQFIIPGNDVELEKIEILMEHFTNIAAVKAESKAGMQFMVYEATGPDHFLHAKLYADVASSTGTGVVLSTAINQFNHPRSISMISNNDRLENRRRTGDITKFPVFNRRRR